MIHQRMAQGVILLFLAGAAFAACSSEPPSTPQDKFCNNKCTCTKCTDAEKNTCVDDLVNLADEAKAEDCSDRYNTYLTCLNADSTCIDGDYDTSICFNEETDLNNCINPPPACTTVEDNVCNEPAPAGDGTCAKGTDTKDCMVPPCPTANDGFCDEPEGSGFCAEGSDPLDCPAPMCAGCYTYIKNAKGNMLCETAATAYSDIYACACDLCGGSCKAIGDLCDFGAVSTDCETCLATFCSTPYNTCTLNE